MKQFFVLAVGIFLCFSCISAGESVVVEDIADNSAGAFFEETHWITRPSGGTITVIGIAGRKLKRDEAIADALTDAARRVSLYYGAYGESTTVLQDGSNLLDYYANTDYRLTIRNSPEPYLDSLVFDKTADVYEKNGSVYVRAQYSGVIELPAQVQAVTEGSPPVWVREYHADIPGFLTGIGNSKNKGTPQKTYQASYENALVSILPRISTKVEESVIDVAGQGRITKNVSVSSGNLSRIMILETWFDKGTGTVWTLLAAKAE
jgi:hypothetical protein